MERTALLGRQSEQKSLNASLPAYPGVDGATFKTHPTQDTYRTPVAGSFWTGNGIFLLDKIAGRSRNQRFFRAEFATDLIYF